jgi:hypothetical protein
MTYNYDNAIKLFVEAHACGENVTYRQLETVLGLEYNIGDKEHISLVNNAIGRLREKLKATHGLVFASACKGKGKANQAEFQYYIISEVKDAPTKKEIKPEKRTETKDANYEALSRDNQKLYAENQSLKLENEELREKFTIMLDREEEYKNIISSLVALAGIN